MFIFLILLYHVLIIIMFIEENPTFSLYSLDG